MVRYLVWSIEVTNRHERAETAQYNQNDETIFEIFFCHAFREIWENKIGMSVFLCIMSGHQPIDKNACSGVNLPSNNVSPKKKPLPLQPPRHRCVRVACLRSESDGWVAHAEPTKAAETHPWVGSCRKGGAVFCIRLLPIRSSVGWTLFIVNTF